MRIAAARKKVATPLGVRGWHYIVVISVLAIGLSGCSTSSPSYEGTLLPCEINAKPVMPSQNMAMLTMSDSRDGVVRTLDGKPFCPQRRCNYHTIVLPPGEHEVIFTYLKSYSVLGPGGSDPVKLTFIAKQGETYRAIVKKASFLWRYKCRIVEASTGQIISEIDDCDRDEIRWPAMREVYDAYGGKRKYIERQCYNF